ncbi:DUF4241 domain-containing protein [Krasilnikovia sp. MM14-A1259]|uniref:DUF4241 domain-containing protein n=1 Tax=Krasilnikovia sp. MM14-A1259 TaxID=3373539 RepID=UPI00382B2328
MGWSRRRALYVGGWLAVNAGLIGLWRWSPSSSLLPHDDGFTVGDVGAQEAVAFPVPERTARLFQDGSRHLLDSGDLAIASTKPAGVLRLPTGQLVAADPSWLPSARQLGIAPYTVTVPPGSYPVALAMVSLPGEQRVAAAKLTIRDQPVTAWEMALRPGQNPATLTAGQAFTVGVDSGTIAIFDGSVLDAAVRRSADDPRSFDLGENDSTTASIDAASKANLVAFRTGWGDGAYPAWIGRTANGAVGCFLFDMTMLAPQPGDTAAATPTPRSSPTG